MLHKTKKLVHNNYFFVACLVFLSWFVASDNLSTASGALFPVVEPLQISSLEVYDDFSTKITGTSTKNYNCDFVGMEWYVEESGVKGVAPSYFLDAPQGRPSGELEFTGIIVGVTPERMDITHSIVTHNCAFGTTVISKWYEGAK